MSQFPFLLTNYLNCKTTLSLKCHRLCRQIQSINGEKWFSTRGEFIGIIHLNDLGLGFCLFLGLYPFQVRRLDNSPSEESFFRRKKRQNERKSGVFELSLAIRAKAIQGNRGRDDVFFRPGWWVASFSPRFAIEIIKSSLFLYATATLSYFDSSQHFPWRFYILFFSRTWLRENPRKQQQQQEKMYIGCTYCLEIVE